MDLSISDSIKKIVKENFTKYVDYFLHHVPEKVEIEKENKITTYYKDYKVDQDGYSNFKNPYKPLFYISNRILEGDV